MASSWAHDASWSWAWCRRCGSGCGGWRVAGAAKNGDDEMEMVMVEGSSRLQESTDSLFDANPTKVGLSVP